MRLRSVLAQLLSSYLLVWVPGTFAVQLLGSFSSLGFRGPAAWLEIGLHGAVAAWCAVAGRMLRLESPSALRVASAGVVLRAGVSLQGLFWTSLPHDVAPGTRGPLAGLVCLNAIFWLLVVRRISRP